MGRQIGSVRDDEAVLESWDLGLVRTCWRKSAPRELSDAGERKRAGREFGVVAETEVGEVDSRRSVIVAKKMSATDMPKRCIVKR